MVMDLWPSQRDTSEIGTPSARAVLANVCRRSWKVVSGVQAGRLDGGLPDGAVVVVATEEGLPGSAAQHGLLVELEPLSVLGDGVLHEDRHGHVANRCGGLGEPRAPAAGRR